MLISDLWQWAFDLKLRHKHKIATLGGEVSWFLYVRLLEKKFKLSYLSQDRRYRSISNPQMCLKTSRNKISAKNMDRDFF